MLIRRSLAVITQQIRGSSEPCCRPNLSSTNDGSGEYPLNALLSPIELLKIGVRRMTIERSTHVPFNGRRSRHARLFASSPKEVDYPRLWSQSAASLDR